MSFFCDHGRIQTCNLLSRNQVRYSVAPRGRFAGANITMFFKSKKLFGDFFSKIF